MAKISQSKIHFIGIGGSGMNGLAELVHNMGARVTGSDLLESAAVTRLKAMGIHVELGHTAKNVEKDVDVVVYSSAVAKTNPEILEAIHRNIPVIPRIEVLSEVMRLKRGIAIGGTHGKTTTTSFIASILIHAGMDPTVVVGGRLDLIKSHSVLGKGEWLVAESDESDGSFLKLSPEIAVITNIDTDHLDHYGSFEALKSAFLSFAKSVPFYGTVIACGDSPVVREALKEFNKRLIYYGFDKNNDLILNEVSSGYEFTVKGESWGRLEWSVSGRHNALNAGAAIAVAHFLGLNRDQCYEGLKKFSGVDRRMQFKGACGNVRVYDDYGHHPTEVKATLQAFREKYKTEKIVVAFQPHRYSRTKICWEEFLPAFESADQVLIWDIYPAGEAEILGITSARLAKEIMHKNVQYVKGGTEALNNTIQVLTESKGAPVILITLGAGDISKKGPLIIDALTGRLE